MTTSPAPIPSSPASPRASLLAACVLLLGALPAALAAAQLLVVLGLVVVLAAVVGAVAVLHSGWRPLCRSSRQAWLHAVVLVLLALGLATLTVVVVGSGAADRGATTEHQLGGALAGVGAALLAPAIWLGVLGAGDLRVLRAVVQP